MSYFNGLFNAQEIFNFEGDQWIISDNSPEPLPSSQDMGLTPPNQFGAEPADVIEITSIGGNTRRISFRAFWNACDSATDLSWA